VSARERILGRVRESLRRRAPTEHPGAFEAWRPPGAAADVVVGIGSAVDGFAVMLEAAGGEVIRQPDVAAASAWLAGFARSFRDATVGATVPRGLRPDLPEASPSVAALGVSMARSAIAETGSLVMDARDGRRSQLLAPTHVVFVHVRDVHPTFRSALLEARGDLPSAIGLHSGPSKSADIGHVMVTGVHGPGRLVAVVIGA
jgi:L-lactate dehydrogenase complex protein LldG